MRYVLSIAGMICSLFLLTSAAAPAQPADDRVAPGGLPELRATFPAGHAPRVADGTWTDRVVGVPGQSTEKVAPHLAVPSFSSSIVAHGRLYKFTMVGSNPFQRNAKKVTVPVQVIPVRFDFPDGTVLDPAAPSSGCAGDSTPLELTLESPIFQNFDYGEGGRQFVEEIRRLEFWSYVAPGRLNPGYSVRLAVSTPTSLHFVLPAGYQTKLARCGRQGLIDYGSWNATLQQLMPQLRKAGVSTKTFPIFLFLNVIVDLGDSGLAAGFHTWINSAGIQTYGVAMYDNTHNFAGSQDISVLSHEIAEWYDDPLVNNVTPPWGNQGQIQDGCYPLLEVGDPLTGSLFEFDMPNGVTYHPQETAYFSWFFNQVPSLGADGLYSSGGSLTAPADICQ